MVRYHSFFIKKDCEEDLLPRSLGCQPGRRWAGVSGAAPLCALAWGHRGVVLNVGFITGQNLVAPGCIMAQEMARQLDTSSLHLVRPLLGHPPRLLLHRVQIVVEDAEDSPMAGVRGSNYLLNRDRKQAPQPAARRFLRGEVGQLNHDFFARRRRRDPWWRGRSSGFGVISVPETRIVPSEQSPPP